MRIFWFVLFELQMLLITVVLVVGWLGMRKHMQHVERSIAGLTKELIRTRPGP